ncbi:MAG: outer membrane beta-barrel protein [Sinimarinibacterium sp.]|jgi:hypothetical protein
MKIKQAMWALALLAMPVVASAQTNQLDLYYVDAGVEVTVPGFGSFDEDGNGYGVKGMFAIADSIFLSGEYQTSNYDDSDTDFEQIRGGVGFAFAAEAPMTWFGLAEAIRIKTDDGTDSDSDSGFGLHVGGRFDFSQAFSLGARVGYIDIDEADGVEWLVDAGLAISPGFGLFADYRLTSLEDEDNDEIEFDDLRLGVRLLF